MVVWFLLRLPRSRQVTWFHRIKIDICSTTMTTTNKKKCPICLRDGVKAENYIACCEACKYIRHWNKHGISVRRVSGKHKRTAQEEFQLFESLAGQASMRAFAWLGLSTLQWTALTYRVLSPVVTGVTVNKCNNQRGMMSLPLFQGGYILHLLKSALF